MTEQPASQSTTQALGGTTVVFGWVEEARVQEVLHASDGFQALLAITLAGVGGAAAAGVTLAAGVTHPVTLYLILAVAVTITVIAGLFGAREYRRYRKVRQSLGAVTAKVPVPVLLVTPGSPSFTVGGQQPFAVGGQQPLSVPPTVISSVPGVTASPSASTVASRAATAPRVPPQEAQPTSASAETSPTEEISPVETMESPEPDG
jgi:hypothetical protein